MKELNVLRLSMVTLFCKYMEDLLTFWVELAIANQAIRMVSVLGIIYVEVLSFQG